ncbi:MAG: universal stress protein [Actinobacteria bacterium]|nr:MAG: universal stress protein [Actinomycetota bacterium]
MARKLPRLQRVLDAPALFSIAYGEIASSIYFALGIIAFHALGFTPGVLLLTGALFLLVSLSYAEGTAAIRETGGAATFVRIAFNDFWGFVTGWALFLDYLIVIALSALYVPHYAAAALFTNVKKPWDVVAGCGVIAAIAAFRLLRNKRIFRFALVIALVDLATQLLLVILGLALLFSPHALNQGTSLGSNPSWHSIAFALPLAMLAYTGLETVANLSEEMRSPGRDLPRSVFGAIGLAVLLYAAIAVVGLSAFPAGHGTQLGSTWAKAPLMGIVSRLRDHLPNVLGAPLQVFVGTTGALILVTAAATSIAGFGRLAYSLGEHGQLPRVFGRLSRRSVIAPQSIIAAALISMALLVTTSAVLTHPIFFLASLYSFGVLLAFTAAQLAVIKLRFSHPKKRRPYRVPLNWGRVPVPAVVGAILTALVWILALATHAGARYGGPVWLAAGLLLYVLLRHSRGEGLTERVVSADEHPDLTEAQYSSILVPLKLGPIGEEMVATAVKLAQESGASVWALHVVRVPMERPLEEELPDEEESAAAALAEAQLLGSDHGVEVKGKTVRARSIGDAIVSQAKELGVDLIVLGSAPKWRRQSRFFSPTVEYVLKKAPCEVLVVAFPQGVLEAEEEESAFAATEASPELI